MSFLQEDDLSLQQVAARIIQRTWRRHVCREVFRYVRSLISQYRQQDPKTVLRSVNPREAELLDAHAGMFIRFRLGGVTFPPNVYYKIFTFRPVVDLCASSPRDYVKQGRRSNDGRGNEQDRAGRYQQDQQDRAGWYQQDRAGWYQQDQQDRAGWYQQDRAGWYQQDQQDRAGWYQRKENNSWRLYSSQAVYTNKPAEISADKQVHFHHSSLQRRQDQARWRKRRKIGWLKKM